MSPTRHSRLRRTVVLLVLLTVYATGYLSLRLNHTLVHRAGNYAHDGMLGIDRQTNHFIEAAPVMDIPGFDTLADLAPSGEESSKERAAYERMVEEITSNAAKDHRRREWLRRFFLPAAICETVYWKVVDPDPVIPMP